MLRTIFVATIAIAGIYYALSQGAFGALLFYLWLAYFRPETWVWEAGWLYALNLSFIGGVYLLLRSLVAGLDWRPDLRSVLLIAFLAVGTVSAWTSDYSEWSTQYLIEFSKACIISFLMSRLLTDEKKFRIAIWVIAVSLGFEGAKQGWGSLITRPGGVNTNTIPLLGDNNGVAIGMLMCTALLVGLAQTATNKKEALLLRFLTAGVAYRAISTYSRGGFLSAGVMIAMYILYSKRKVASMLGIAILAGGIYAVLPAEFWNRMGTIRVNEEELEDASSLGRLHFWRVAMDIAADHPVVGVGLNAYSRIYDEYDFTEGRYGSARAVHSSWFGVLSELGYIGFVLYVSILLLAFRACWQAAKRAKRGKAPPHMYNFAVALQTALIACVVGSSFVSWQYNEMLWNTIGLTMALDRLTKASAAAADKDVVAVRPEVVVPPPHRRTA